MSDRERQKKGYQDEDGYFTDKAYDNFTEKDWDTFNDKVLAASQAENENRNEDCNHHEDPSDRQDKEDWDAFIEYKEKHPREGGD